MNKIEMVITEIKKLPEPLLDEVLDFVQFLKTKMIREKMDIMMASESALKKDWLSLEEDEAWQDL